MRPARGTYFVARGEVIKVGRTLTFVHGEMRAVSVSGEAELIATIQATMMCLRRA